MPNSLIEELPKIVAQGKREAERILDSLSKTNRITLQTNELVLPTKATGGYFGQPVKTDYKNEWFNRLIYGINSLLFLKIHKASQWMRKWICHQNTFRCIDPFHKTLHQQLCRS